MTTDKIQKIEEACVAISLQISLWGGRRKLNPEDLGSEAKLPPDKLASLGSKKICDPNELKIFNTIKTRAENLLKRVGIGNLFAKSCFVIPNCRIQEVIAELVTIRNDFNQARDQFLKNYDKRLEDWIVENDEWRSLIEGSLLSKEEVRNKIGFDFTAFAFGQTMIPELDNEFSKTVGGLNSRLFFEISVVAKDSFERSFEFRDSVTDKSLGPLRVIREKLKGFTICSVEAQPLVDDIDAVLNSIPRNGQPITGSPLFALRALLALLSAPTKALEYARKKLAGISSLADWREENDPDYNGVNIQPTIPNLLLPIQPKEVKVEVQVKKRQPKTAPVQKQEQMLLPPSFSDDEEEIEEQMSPQLPAQPSADVEILVEEKDPLEALKQAVEEYETESKDRAADFDFDQDNIPSLVSELDTDLRAFDEAEFGETLELDLDSLYEDEVPVVEVNIPDYELSW